MHGFLVAARPLYLPGALALFGLGALLSGGAFRALPLAVGVLVVTLVHVVTHYVNDAEDVATDALVTDPTFATGGSRAIQRGLVDASGLRRAAGGVAAVVLGLGALAAARGEVGLATTSVAMLGLGYGYSGPPFAFGRHLLGEATAGVVMGLLVPLAGAFAAGGAPRPLLALAPGLVLQTVFARLCTAWPDIDADRATAKWTLPAALGHRRSAAAFALTGGLVAVAGLVAAPSLPSPDLQVAAALLVAGFAGVLAFLVGSGRARPAVVPALGLAAYAISLAIVTVAVVRG